MTSIASLLALEALVNPRPGLSGIMKPRTGFMVALMAPLELRSELAAAAGAKEESLIEDDLHVTLNYIEGTDTFGDVVRIVTELVTRSPTIELVTTRAGFFRQPDRGRLVHYLGVAGSGLDALASSIRWTLRRAGINADSKFEVFTPHMTIQYLGSGNEEYDMTRILKDSLGADRVRFVPDLAVVSGYKRVMVPWADIRS